jgi:flagellar motility protein MotE (MotC chaperone)
MEMSTRRLRTRILRLGLAVVLGGNVLLLGDVLLPGRIVPWAIAQGSGAPGEAAEGEETPGPPRSFETVYRDLVTRLEGREKELDGRARDLVDRERRIEVLLADLETAHAALAAAQEQDDGDREGFQHLLRAYENMEPENAARALEKLHEKDSTAVTDTLLGLGPRKSGAILDAIAASRPELAAEVSFEIIRRGGRVEPASDPGA